MNIGKYFRRYSPIDHLLPALQVSANFVREMSFCFKLKFSLEKLKKLR